MKIVSEELKLQYFTPECFVTPIFLETSFLTASGLRNNGVEDYDLEEDSDNWF